MIFTAKQIADILNGQVEGDETVSITGIGKIENATSNELTFLTNSKYEEYIYSTQAGLVLINKDYHLQHPVKTTLIRVDDAYASLALLLEKYNEIVGLNSVKNEIEIPSYIDPSAKIGNNIYIGAFSYISKNAVLGNNTQIYPNVFIGKNVTIGAHCIIYPNVSIYHDTIIGDNCIIHSGTVIGSDGFGFAPQADNTYKKIPQIGNVILENDVEIGANCTIDRATMGHTIIKKGVKLDNLIQLAHNAEIGENCVVAAQTGIAGSSKVGSNCIIGGQVGIAGHLTIANFTSVNAQSGISKNITVEHTSLNGTPAFEYKKALKSQAIFRHLPDLMLKLATLEKEIEALKNRKDN
jgi:UDP-3-O-[3-hydroxymyristoyl] glucosamine N-acyltransferase